MTDFFGFFGLTAGDVRVPEISNRLAVTKQNQSPENRRAFTESGGVAGQCVHQCGSVTVLLHGNPVMGGRNSATTEAVDANGLVRLYRLYDIDFIEQIAGSFVLAIHDRERNRTLLAVDRMGIMRLAYKKSGSGLVFSDSAFELARCLPERARLREQAYFDYIFFDMIPAPDTVFENIFKIPPGCIAEFSGGDVAVRRYWTPDYRSSQPQSFSSLKDELLLQLEEAVRDSSPDDACGAFLSGGLDSSSVTGMLAKVRGRGVPTFSIGFGHPDYDELSYARIASEHFGSAGHYYNVTPKDIVSSVPSIARAYDEPFGNSSAVPTYFCARLAAESGITHLLGGDGGDELFGGNERYAKQKVFGLFASLPRWIRDGIVARAADGISSDSSIMPLRKFRSYVEQARIPLPDRFATWNFVFREGADHIFDPEYLGGINQNGPLETMRKVWNSAPNNELLEQMLWFDWHFTLADNDLRKVNNMCTLAGVRVSYPMLNDRLVALSCRIPASLKMRRLDLRTFYRKAMRDFLPAEVLSKHKHGFGLPFGAWLKSDPNLRELVTSNLTDIRKRHIVSRTFIDGLMTQFQAGQASYFGYIIWNLMMLEEWLKQHDFH